MKNRPRVSFSLTIKIALLMVVTMAIFITLISDLVARSVRAHTITHLTDDLEMATGNFFARVIADGQLDDPQALQASMENFAEGQLYVEEIFIVDPDDVIYAHNDPSKVGQPLSNYDTVHQAREIGTVLSKLEQAEGQDRLPRLSVVLPLYSDGQPVGVGVTKFLIKLQLENLDLIRQRIILTMAVGGAGLTLLLIVSLYLLIVRPIRVFMDVAEMVSQGDLSQRMNLERRDELGALAISFNRMIQGLRSVWERFLPPQVVERIARDPHAALVLGGERLQVTVLFSDIRNFTTISEQMSPERLVRFLNEYFAAMTTVIYKYEGTLDKYLGDGIMAIFGAPFTQADDAFRAVNCALEMQAAMATLNSCWAEEQGPHWDMGIGLATGEVVAGNVGSAQRMDYTVIGDTVNVASRLEGQTRGGQVLICQNTRDKVGEMVCCQSLPPMNLKGKMEAVAVYQVLEITPSASRPCPADCIGNLSDSDSRGVNG